ncbi:MAG: glycosyltransferase family 87 protein [Bacteroidota bacterium]
MYKYTPTFAVFFGALAILPDWTGLTLWNLINAIILLLAIYYLPKFTDREKGIILLIVLIELMTSMQNEQSNGLIAGLLVFTFGFLEKEKYAAATFCVVFSCFIKLFGIVGMALFLFYPKKWKLAIYSVGWTIFLFAVPLIFVDTAQYQNLLQSYGKLLTNDHNASLGYSVMGWLHSWFNVSVDKLSMVLVGVVIFMAPISKLQNFKLQPFRLLTLTSILIWIVIFNHKAESPTFILAMTGVAIWFVWSEKNIINITLFILAFIFTSLSPTDIFPKYIRDELVKPYTLKAVPCILIWIKIIYDMFLLKPSRQEVILDQKDR